MLPAQPYCITCANASHAGQPPPGRIIAYPACGSSPHVVESTFQTMMQTCLPLLADKLVASANHCSLLRYSHIARPGKAAGKPPYPSLVQVAQLSEAPMVLSRQMRCNTRWSCPSKQRVMLAARVAALLVGRNDALACNGYRYSPCSWLHQQRPSRRSINGVVTIRWGCSHQKPVGAAHR